VNFHVKSTKRSRRELVEFLAENDRSSAIDGGNANAQNRLGEGQAVIKCKVRI
jgi:hypothetical protein